MTNRWIVRAGLTALVLGAVAPQPSSRAQQRQPAAQPVSSRATPGQSATLLPDGRWLFVGGVDADRAAVVWDPRSNAVLPTTGQPEVARAFHSATVLPDGTVLIAGGQQGDRLADVPEIFDPTTGLFMPHAMGGSVPRASHSATLLTDGRVLIAGGSNGGAVPLATEIWDVVAQTVTPIDRGSLDRAGHTATLMPDGRVVLVGGRRVDGSPARDADVFDARTVTVRQAALPKDEAAPPVVAASPRSNGSTDVPVDTRIVVRFSDAMAQSTITAASLALRGPAGAVATRIVAAEHGRLAFVWPAERLADGTRYVLTVAGAQNAAGLLVAPASIVFTTAQRSDDTSPTDDEEWIPDESSVKRGWRTNRPPSPWESLPPLTAPPGVTAISGRALTLNGLPLPNVTFSMADDRRTTTSDRTGRFLLILDSPTPGRRVLHIDGTTAARGRRTYGYFEYGSKVVGGQTNVLPFTIWMPALDTRHAVTIPSPTTREVVVTTPYIPGLELHIPANTTLRGRDGKPVTQVTLTPVPVDRPPFPLARNVEVPVYFTAQPGGTYVATSGGGPRGAWLVYPNAREWVPGQRGQFFHYDPESKDWFVYGPGAVTQNGKQVRPEPTTRFYEFTGAMFGGPSDPSNGGKPGGPSAGDPIDPATGVFLMHKTDLHLPDTIPIALTRTYNSGDNVGRPFGTGMVHPYSMFLWSAHQYTEVDLILPEGGKVHFVRTSAGTGWTDAVLVHQETQNTSATPTRFYKAQVTWNGLGWDLTLKDGTVYVFGENAPLQAIRDRYGNTLRIEHTNAQAGNVTRVTSPNGRWIAFTYDGNNRITQAKDNLGRTVTYAYTNSNLTSVTDPENNVTTYGYDTSNRMTTITDGRNITYLRNTYVNGRVAQQVLANTSDTYRFAYTVNGSGVITQTDVTDPRGNITRLAFNGDGYVTTATEAYGTALARTTTIERQTGSNLVTATVDAMNRRTEYTYDSSGHVLTVKRLAGTADAVTATFTYEQKFLQLATVTDPLNHTWTLTYDANGVFTGSTDQLNHHTTVTLNQAGQVTSVSDSLNHIWQFGYLGGDRISTTNPLSAVWTQFIDGAGRALATTDPLGRVTRTTVDKLDRPTQVIDPLGGQTSFTYDANSNLLSLNDALSHTTTYSYDLGDRVATRTDPLTKIASYTYDGLDNLTQSSDRKGQVTSRTYDALNRLSVVTFDDTSTVTYTYDAGDRATQMADSSNGTITRTYDGLNRLTQETTPQGTVTYTYDGADRRTTMTVGGQTQVSYAYDNTNRLTSITQGTSVVSFTYDNADRRSTVTYPNGILATYGYDNANHLTSTTYTLTPTGT